MVDKPHFWRSLDDDASGFGLAFLVALVAVPLDLFLWGRPPLSSQLIDWIPDSGRVLAPLLTVVCLLQSWQFELLRRRLVAMEERRGPRRLPLAALCGFPLLGPFLLHLDLRASTVPKDTAGVRCFSWPRLRLAEARHGRLRSLSRDRGLPEPPGGWLIWWSVANVGLLGWGTLWLVSLGRLAPRYPLSCWLACGALHLAAFAGAWEAAGGQHGWIRWEGRELWFRRWASLLWLFPLPGTALALLIFLAEPRAEGRRQATFVRAAFRTGAATDKLARWRSLGRLVRRSWEEAAWWERWRSPPGDPRSTVRDEELKRLARLCRLKAWLASLDGAFLGWGLAAGARRGWMRVATVEGVVGAALWVGVMVALGSLAIAFLFELGVLLRFIVNPRVDGPHVRGRFFGLAWLGVGLGGRVGCELGAGRPGAAGVWLALPLAAVLAVLGFGWVTRALRHALPNGALLAGVEGEGAELSTAGGLLVLASLGVALARPGSGHSMLSRLLPLLLASVPVWHLLLASSLGPWLDSYAAGRALSGSRALKVVLMIPFGGLVMPAWIGSGRRPAGYHETVRREP